jgi:hypothetical protein
MHIRPWPLEILAYRALSGALFFLSCPLTNDYNTIGQHLSERKLFEKNKKQKHQRDRKREIEIHYGYQRYNYIAEHIRPSAQQQSQLSRSCRAGRFLSIAHDPIKEGEKNVNNTNLSSFFIVSFIIIILRRRYAKPSLKLAHLV